MKLETYQENAAEWLSRRKMGMVVAPAGSKLTNDAKCRLIEPALVRLQKALEHRQKFGSFGDCRSLCAGTTFDGRAILCVMPIVKCHNCGQSFKRDQNQINRATFSFCSKQCKSDNADFNRLAGDRNGEVQRFRGDGKTYTKLNGRHMHRAIAEQVLGRKLVAGEIVHHRDGDIHNNAPENLLVTTQSEHMKIHLPEMLAARRERCGY